MDPALAAYLATHDAPCLGCGYNLRGLAEPRCPECGREATLHELTNPAVLESLREEIWLLKGAAVGFGIDLLVLPAVVRGEGLIFAFVLSGVLIGAFVITVAVTRRLVGVLRAPHDRRPKHAPSVGAFLWCVFAWMPLLLLAAGRLA